MCMDKPPEFDEWVDGCFTTGAQRFLTREGGDDPGHRDRWAVLAPSVALRYITRLFETPAGLGRRYPQPQVDAGLEFILMGGHSYLGAFTDISLPWESRRRGIESITVLYRELFAPLYGDNIGGNTSNEDRTFRNVACYMWWDVGSLPLGRPGHPERGQIDELLLKVFREVLQVRSEACLESVLHGLGHWHFWLPGPTGEVVRDFLAMRDDLSDEIRQYAESTARGLVL